MRTEGSKTSLFKRCYISPSLRLSSTTRTTTTTTTKMRTEGSKNSLLFFLLLLLLLHHHLPTVVSQSLCAKQTPAVGANTVDCLCGAAVTQRDGSQVPQTLCSLTPNANGMITGRYCTHSAARCDQVPSCSGALSSSPLTVSDHTLAYPGCAITIPLGLKISDNSVESTTITGTPEAGTGNLPMLSGGHVNRILWIDGPLTLTDVRLVRGRTGQCTCDWMPDSIGAFCENPDACGDGVNVGGWPSVGARICKDNVDEVDGQTNDMVTSTKCSGGLVFIGKGERRQDNGENYNPSGSFAEFGQQEVMNVGRECFLTAPAGSHSTCSNTNVPQAVVVLQESQRRELTALRVTFEYGVAYQAGAVMVQHGRFKCTDCEMKYSVVKPSNYIGPTSLAGAIKVQGCLSRMELVRGDIHHNEAFDGAGIYIEGSVRVWIASGTNIRDNVAPAEGTSNLHAGVSSQWPRYCVTHKDTGVIESTVATWNDDFESRSENECTDKSSNHRWIWPGFNFCPEGMYTSSTRQSSYETSVLGCPNFCASGKYSGAGAGFRITCSNTCDRGAYCPAGSVNPYPCPGGTYGTEEGQFLVTSCKNCLAGFYNNGQTPATSCKSCPAGYAQSLSSSSYCLPCIPGRYNDQETGGILECKRCEKGKSQYQTSQSSCEDCIAGTFTDQLDQSSCKNCIPGKYQKETGQQACHNCVSGKYQDVSKGNNCKDCDTGQFINGEGNSGCLVCSIGKYGNEVAQTLCKDCSEGQFQSNTGQRSCSDCIAGTFAAGKAATNCGQCQKGQMSSGSMNTACSICQAGKFSSSIGRSTCESCTEGQYAALVGASGCLNCPLGRYSSEVGKGKCLRCSTLKYQDVAGSIKCKVCDVVGQTPNDASTDCINPSYTVKSDCKDIEYLDNADADRDNHICRPCPAGASCIGWIDWTEVSGVFGWSRCPAKSGATKGNDVMKTTKTKEMNGNSSTVIVVRPEIFERCSFAASCLGKENKDLERKFVLSPDISRNEQCNEGYLNDSRLCYACESGYSHAGDLTGRCSKCPSPAENIAVAITAGIFGLLSLCLYLYITLNDGGKHDSSDSFKMIALNFIQLLTLLTTFPIEWPPIFTALFRVGGAITALGQHFVNLKCLLPLYTDAEVFYMIIVVWCIMPFALNLVITLVWLIAARVRPSKIHDVWQSIKSCLVATIYLLYPTLITQTFSLFACRSVCPSSSDEGSSFLRADLEEPCGQGRHLAFMLLLGVPMLIVFVLGLPMLGMMTVWRIRRNAHRAKRHSMHLQVDDFVVYGMLFSMFREDTWYWEASVALRKIVFVAIGVFGGNWGQMQVHVTSMFLLIIILATAIVRPFELGPFGKLLQLLELMSLMAVWLSLWGALVFFSYPRCEAYYGAARNDEDEIADSYKPGQTLLWCDIIAVTVGIVDMCVVAAVSAGLLYKMKFVKDEKKRQELMNQKHGGKMTMTNLSHFANLAKTTREFALDLEKEVEKSHPNEHQFNLSTQNYIKNHASSQNTFQHVMQHSFMMKQEKSAKKINEIIEKEREDEKILEDHLVKRRESTHNQLEIRKKKSRGLKEKTKSSVYVIEKDEENKGEKVCSSIAEPNDIESGVDQVQHT